MNATAIDTDIWGPAWAPATPAASPWGRLKGLLPQGGSLLREEWDQRHRAIVVILWLYAAGLVLFGSYRGYSLQHLAVDGGAVAMLAAWATQPFGGRQLRSAIAAVGLLTAASVGVHLSGGQIEAHFQFFVVISILMLYQDWLPFAVAIAFVIGEHGVVGVIVPGAVYNHAAAQSNPWFWAAIHGAFVIAASIANLSYWRLNEAANARVRAGAAGYRRLFANNPQPMWIHDTDTLAFLDVNDAALMRYGYSRDQFLTMTINDIRFDDAAPGGDTASTRSALMVESSGPWRHKTRDGRVILTQITSHAIPYGNGTARHVMADDVTDREALLGQLRHEAFHDSLTGLPNRTLVIDRLGVMLEQSRRRRTAVAVLFCDLDGFKGINDSLGHAIGDELIREAALRLQATARAEDTVARLGGDEFVVVSEVPGEAEAVTLAERLNLALTQPMSLKGHEVRITSSVGISLSRGTRTDAADLIRNADIAMYRAKTGARGQVEVFDMDMHVSALRRLGVEQDLRPAMGRGEFELWYQPLVEGTDRHLVGLEALIRWHHPERGLLAPGEFIEIAEESGFILTLGAWAVGEACLQLAQWQREEKPLKVHVNLSALQLTDPGLVDHIAGVLKATGVWAEDLVLEITESVLMQNVDVSLQTLLELRALGVGISIDDFGTGHSSLSYLARLPLNSLKIDKSFVTLLGSDERSRFVAATVIDLAHNLGVTAIAEGVETEAQFAMLQDLGCDVFQGYLVGRPEPALQISSWGAYADALRSGHTPAA